MNFRTTAVVLALLGGCNPQPPTFGTLQYDSEAFEVWASDGLVACDGTYAYMEGWYAAFNERLGDDARPQYFVFNWVTQQDHEASPCAVPEGECALPKYNYVYSRRIPLGHEVVHTQLDLNKSPSFFDEGAAEVFGSMEGLYETGPEHSEEIPDLLEIRPNIPSSSYATAARFTRYAIDTYGLGAFLEAARASPEDQGFDGAADAFDGILGEDLRDVVADVEALGDCPVRGWRFRDYECSGIPPTPWVDAAVWEDAISVDCVTDDAIGPHAGYVWVLRAVEIPETGQYRVRITGAGDEGKVELTSCDVSCEEPTLRADAAVLSFVASSADQVMTLAQGRYWIRATLEPGGASRQVTLRLSREG